MEQATNDCNCIEHFCCGYEAGKRDATRKPVMRMSHAAIWDISAYNLDRRYEGNYAVVVYHNEGNSKIFTGGKSWMLALEILTEKCGVNITRLTFAPDPDVKTYEYELIED
jgi:hypothetical protein